MNNYNNNNNNRYSGGGGGGGYGGFGGNGARKRKPEGDYQRKRILIDFLFLSKFSLKFESHLRII